MPTINTSTIGPGGGRDYSTIAAWEAAKDNDLVSLDVVEIGELDEAANFDESVTIAGATTDATRYRKLTVGDSYWHEGDPVILETLIARMVGNPSGRQINIDEDYFWTERFYISHRNQSPNSSDEAFRCNVGTVGTLISDCIMRGQTGVQDCDGIYLHGGSGTGSITVYNCVIHDWNRGGVHAQYFSNGSADWTINADHNTLYNNGRDGANDGGGIILGANSATSSAVATFNLYNNVSRNGTNGNGICYGVGDNTDVADITLTWSGSHNACTDTSLTTIGLTIGAQESLTDTTIWTDPVNRDFSPVAGEALEDNGTNRQSNKADSRADYAKDITGETRGTTGVEIGAYVIADSGTVSAGAMSATGASTDTFTGGSTASADLSAAGVGASNNVGASIHAGDFSAVGSAVFANVGTGVIGGSFSSDGVATVAHVGVELTISEGAMQADGVSVNTLTGASTHGGAMAAAGSAVGSFGLATTAGGALDAFPEIGVEFVGAATAEANLSSDGIATATYVGIVTVEGALAVSGASVNTFVGEEAGSIAAGAMTINGSAAANLTGGAVSEAVFSSIGSANVEYRSPSLGAITAYIKEGGIWYPVSND